MFLFLRFVGASNSSSFLYLETKGRTENAVVDLDFQSTAIYRPGVLITPEGQNEIRAMEWLAQSFFSVFDWGQHFSLPVKQLAKAMVYHALKDATNKVNSIVSGSESPTGFVNILENKQIAELGQLASLRQMQCQQCK